MVQTGALLLGLSLGVSTCLAAIKTVPLAVNDKVTSVIISGPMVVEIGQSSVPAANTTANEDVLSHLVSEVHGSKLTLSLKGSVTFTGTLNIDIAVKDLQAIDASDTAKVTAEAINGTGPLLLSSSGASTLIFTGSFPEVRAAASGASKIRASTMRRFEATHVEAVAEGASTIDMGGYSSAEADVRISMGSHATVAATDAVRGEVTMASSLTVHGRPAQRSVSVEMASSIGYQ